MAVFNKDETVEEKDYKYDKIQEASKFIYNKIEDDEGQKLAIDYLSEFRDLDREVLRNSGVFFAENEDELELLASYEPDYIQALRFYRGKVTVFDRYLFPIRSGNGNLLSWIGYDWESASKYLVVMLGIGDKKRLIYGMDHMSYMYDEDTVIVVEGIFDALRLREIGINVGISLLGKRMSKWQKKFLNRFKNIILMPDGDSSGQDMIEQWMEGLNGNIAVVRLKQVDREFYSIEEDKMYNKTAKDIDDRLRGSIEEKERFVDLYENIKIRLKESKLINIEF